MNKIEKTIRTILFSNAYRVEHYNGLVVGIYGEENDQNFACGVLSEHEFLQLAFALQQHGWKVAENAEVATLIK